MSSAGRANALPTALNKVEFKFHDLEITPDAVVLHFFEERTVIPLKEIVSYELNWHLHDPIFARKYWFLELTFQLPNGEEQSWPIAVVKFNYLDDAGQRRQHIERKIAEALDAAFSARGDAAAQKNESFAKQGKRRGVDVRKGAGN